MLPPAAVDVTTPLTIVLIAPGVAIFRPHAITQLVLTLKVYKYLFAISEFQPP